MRRWKACTKEVRDRYMDILKVIDFLKSRGLSNQGFLKHREEGMKIGNRADFYDYISDATVEHHKSWPDKLLSSNISGLVNGFISILRGCFQRPRY